jgi:hypothetical protein
VSLLSRPTGACTEVIAALHGARQEFIATSEELDFSFVFVQANAAYVLRDFLTF